MFQAYKKYWLNYVNFEGRASRSDYWWSFLTNFLIGFIFCVIALTVFYSSVASGLQQSLLGEELGFHIIASMLPFWLIAVIWYFVNFLPGIAISVRRLRDAGYHWAFVLLGHLPGLLLFVPILNILAFIAILPCGIALIVLLAMPTKEQPIGIGYPNGGYSEVDPQAPGFQGQAQNFGQATNFSGMNTQQSASGFRGQPQSFGQAGQQTSFNAQQPTSGFQEQTNQPQSFEQPAQPTAFSGTSNQPVQEQTISTTVFGDPNSQVVQDTVNQEQANQAQSFGQPAQSSQEQTIPSAVFGDANNQVAQEPAVQEIVSQEQAVQEEGSQGQAFEEASAEAAFKTPEADKQDSQNQE